MTHHLASDSETTSAATPSAKSSPAPVNVWLVDDNRRLRTVMAECLQVSPGVQCTGSFPSPNAVLSALASKPGPDVILLDIQMGEACGLDAIRSIKSLSRSTQVLMFTTFFDSEAERRALRDGASGLLLKSFPLNEILQSIHQAAKHPAPHLKRSVRADTATAPAEAESATWLKQCLAWLRHRWN
jgi:DNA-binding NarL/FixJ family response regulator